MRRVVKVVLWVVVFSACAVIGAYVAAHTDPFPPGVEDPGVRPTDAGQSDVPQGGLVVQIDVRTFHDLYVGGRCAASWRIVIDMDDLVGSLDGSGTATIKGPLRCDEPTAQVQTERIDLRAIGMAVDGELRFRLDETGRAPVGAQELSGFTRTIPTLRFELPARDGASASIEVEVPDRDRGTYRAVGEVVVHVTTDG